MRYELSDCEWSVIKPMLLERERREELVQLLRLVLSSPRTVAPRALG